jgi:acyl transferase domain-containing protein/thioesterase domain-containing protein
MSEAPDDRAGDAAAEDDGGARVAVIGMAGRFPGSPSIDAYWKNLRAGVESVKFFTDEELLAAGESPEALRDPAYVKAWPVLEDMDLFDAGFFGMSPRDAAVMDPQHRFFLEVAWSALEHAGYAPDDARSRSIGVFAANGMNTYMMYHLVTNPEIMSTVGEWLVRHTGNDMNFLATRVSYQMNLKGPSLNVQTACSSALVALHLASQSLLNGECDVALAGASAFSLPQNKGYLFKEGEILSRDGHCRPFDAGSRGTLFGSGTGCVVLKRLADARADGDNVLAVLLGSAVNNDGSRKVGYLAPSVDGQARAIAEALAISGVDPASVSYIETHGTGTAVGDPIEVAALNQAYGAGDARPGTCAIGSVKGNIGHIGEAAGMAGLIKTILALQHRELPPSINYERPNPEIDFARGPFFVNDKLRPWSAARGARRRAGVTALGAGGTNVHVIVEEAPPVAPRTGTTRAQQLFVLSAKSAGAVERAAGELATHLEANPGLALADVAHTLQVGRKAFAHRRIATGHDVASVVASLREPTSKSNTNQLAGQGAPTVVFMFPGGGAQYAGMGRDLAASEPVYAHAVDECLATLEPAAARELRALMVPGAGEAAQAAASATLERPSLALPALFATEYALAKLLASSDGWGVEPAAFIGHSMGEYVAACLAGVFSVKDGMALVRLRGRLFERLPPGGMLSVELGEAELTPLLGPELSIAAVNAPALCVASGPVAALDRLERDLGSREIETTRIHISVAAHSKMLEPILAELEAFCRTLRFSAPTVPFVSNVTGTWITPELAVDPAYWVRHLRSTVRFSDGLATIARGGEHVLLEVGPGRTLASLARQHAGAGAAMPSMRHPREAANDVSFLLQSVGRAWLAGAPIDFARLGGESRRRVPLPTYSFERNRYWIEAGSPTAGAKTKGPLRKLPDLASWFYAPTWKPAPAPPPGEPTGAPWLVFDGATGLADALAARLPDQPLVRVVAGPAYAKVSDDHYVIRPDAREDYETLVAELQQQDRLPEQIVHLWGVTVAKPEWPRALLARLGRAPEASAGLDYDETERLCFTSLLYVAQTFGPLEKPFALSIVSTGLHGFKAERPVEPGKALLLGPARVIPREFPQVQARSIDLPNTFEGVEASLERLVLELASAPRETVVALRGRERWTQGFEPLTLAASEGVPGLVRPGGVYLVTGGLGGIGLELAAHLAATARAKLVLVGRTPLPPRSRWEALAAAGGALGRRVAKVLEIEAAGGEVLVAAADVTSRADMERVRARARARFGEVNGVIHSAGTLDDGLISLKTREAAHRVIDVKARGALVLDEVFGKDELDLFVVFSSVSSVLGLEGQIDYTAANAFLDAFAERKTAEGRTHAVSIAWNAWQEVGMAAGLGGKSTAHASRGTEAPAAGPWLERRQRDTADETLYVTTFARGKQWVLSEHVVREGQALIPGTGYLELARAAFSGGAAFAPVEIRDLTFLAPFVVAAGHPRDLHVRLAGAGDERELTIYSTSAEEPHVTGRVARAVTPPPARADVAALLGRCSARELVAGGFLPQPFMDFGPRWANVDRVCFGAGEAVVALALPDALAADLADFPLHPALLDMATGGAQALIEGFDPDKDFYVPFAYGRFTAHRPLTTRLWSHVRARGGAGRDLALFDVTIYDAQGEVVADIAGFTMKRVARGFSTAAAPAASRDGFGEGKLGSAVKLGILPAEGRDAFDRVLAARLPGHVVASSVDLRDWMAQVEEQARPGGAGGDAEEAGFARPALGAAFVPPRNEVERSLATMWREILGLKEVGVHDDFFELGGQSLVAVRLFNKIRKRYGVDLPLSTLFAAPTIESCARVVAHEAGLPLVDDEPGAGDAAAPAPDGAPAKIETDPSRWFHRLAWRQRARERATGRERRVWLAFLDATGAVASLAERLRADGDTVVTVREGDTFHKLGDDEYQLFPEQGREGYEALLRDLEDNGRAPDGILHAWLLTDRETFRPGSSFLHRNVEVGFFSLLALGQALATREDPRPVHLVALTTGMQRVAQEPLRYPEKAAALGPLLALAREVPGLTASAVDVELPTRQGGLLGRVAPSPKSMLQAFATRGARPAGDEDPMAPLVEALRAEVLSPSRDEIVALRGASRYVLGVERATLDAAPTRAGLKDRGVVLLTGGLDGPGAGLARELATRHQARLVLLEPTPLPDAADRVAWLAAHAEDHGDDHADDQPAAALVRRVLELEALGAEVMTTAAEITDVERLREVVSAVEARWGRLDGVIHAGAAPGATPVVETRLADVTNVFAPRVYGTLALAEALRERSLDFFVTWSPASPMTAEAGQAVDVAAAAFLGAFAETARDRRMLALDGGADLDAAQTLDVLERAIRGCPHAKVLVSRVDPTAARASAPASPLPPAGAAAPPSASRRAGGGDLGIADIGPNARLMHLVKMHPGPALSKPPFFLIAGLFGNVLNLRSLAHILGSDRAVYGLQARGLFGGLEPHETFEEMASDYLVELRALQPHGPYFLGGFSGGGITAYEMARQLMDAGETVRLVVLLDTPVPRRETLSATDRASIQVQNLQREGVQYFSRWMQSKIEYRLKLQRREEQLRKQQGGESRDFHSQVIEAAFYRALDRYTVRPLAVPVALFRPKIEPTYRLSGGRMLDKGRSPLYPDNGWTPYVTRQLEIVEVPGNHDSMVLEPNVRVLAARIDEAMARASQPSESEPFARVSGEGA